MPKLKTHKGTKKRFKVSANGKVSHKRCGSSHLMSHKSGKQVRRLRKKSFLSVEAEAHRLRRALHKNIGVNPVAVEVERRVEEVGLLAVEDHPDVDELLPLDPGHQPQDDVLVGHRGHRATPCGSHASTPSSRARRCSW